MLTYLAKRLVRQDHSSAATNNDLTKQEKPSLRKEKKKKAPL